MSEDCLRILELFSGIGGMHLAAQASGLKHEIVAAIEINPVANAVYSHNFPDTTVMNNNIQSLTAQKIVDLGANTIAMSPPCQPFTRNGNLKDVKDPRADPFLHICDLLDKIPSIEFILMENVKGFETSQACELYKSRLKEGGFHFQEYILSPHDYGVLNTRHRYYCLARRQKPFNQKCQFVTKLSGKVCAEGDMMSSVVEEDDCSEYLLSDDMLRKRLSLLDIRTSDADNSMCFTKAYTHYAEGTGSVYTPLTLNRFDELHKQMEKEEDKDEKLKLMKQLELRYFTPKEVTRLMCFKEAFEFPPATTKKQKYRLLGNSINVLVVSFLFVELASDLLE